MNLTNIDTGTIIVVAAVLIFYLRLIILQRERAKQVAREAAANAKKKGKGKGKKQPAESPPRYSILSRNRRDLFIAGAGLVAILLGVLFSSGVLKLPGLQSYWWLPTAAGIVAFSWAFQL